MKFKYEGHEVKTYAHCGTIYLNINGKEVFTVGPYHSGAVKNVDRDVAQWICDILDPETALSSDYKEEVEQFEETGLDRKRFVNKLKMRAYR